MEQTPAIGQRFGISPLKSSDEELLERVAARDKVALAELYDRYGDVLLRFLLQLCPDHSTAEDVLQDTLVAIWRSARTYARRSSPRTWLIGVARRQAHNSRRRQQFPTEHVSQLTDVVSHETDPAEQQSGLAQQLALREAMTRLPTIHREVLFLTFVEGLSYQETADVVGVPIGTVRSRLSNAKAALRRELDDEPEQFSPVRPQE